MFIGLGHKWIFVKCEVLLIGA